MTREELVAVIKSTPTRPGGFTEYEDIADRILAALAKEREGEVTLAEGDFMDFMDIEDWNMPLDIGCLIRGIGTCRIQVFG